jgi:hypothetical protein
MEYIEAAETIENFTKALSAIKMKAFMYENTSKRNVKLDEKVKELEKTISELKQFKYYFNKLAAASKVAICGQCDGRGGFDYDDGHGSGGSEPCLACEGGGIVDKSTLPPIEKEVKQNTNDKQHF